MQDGGPIAFLSKAFCNKNKGLSVYEKELLALVMAVTQWRHYLIGHHFIIKTDHQALKYLLEQKLNSPLQHKWLTKLLGLDYEIQYKKGSENKAADALSRMHLKDEEELVAEAGEEMEVCNQIQTRSTVIPLWMQQVESSYNDDECAKEQIAQCLLQQEAGSDWQFVEGLLKWKGKIYVGRATNIKQMLLEAVHSSPIGGHSGQMATFKRLNSCFFWPRMRMEVDAFIQQCITCQRNKAEHMHIPGLLQPITIPQQIWKHISMDFIEGLPISEGYNTVMVVVDRLSKYGHFISLSHPYNAQVVADLFLKEIYK